MRGSAATRWFGFLALVAVSLLVTAPAALAQGLQVAPAGGAAFPNRTLVVSVPQKAKPSASSVHVTENGSPITDLSVTPQKQAGAGSLGVVLMIDTDSTMIGAPLDRALAAARTLVAQRTGSEKLGVIFGYGQSVPLTTNSTALDRALARPPQGSTPMTLLQMTKIAVHELGAAGLTDGAIIYVTDDIDRSSTFTPSSVGAYAAAAHVRIFTIGVRDAIWKAPLPPDLPSPASMKVLARASGGNYLEASPGRERKAFLAIESGLLDQYIVRYRSDQPPRTHVGVYVHVDGVPGTASLQYRSPAPAPSVRLPQQRPQQPRSFWASTLALVLTALAAGLLIGIALAVVFGHVRSGLLRARVLEFVPSVPELVRGRASSDQVGMLEAMLKRRKWWPAFVEQVDISAFERRPVELVRFAIAGSLLAFAVIWLATGSFLVGLLGLAVGPLALRSLVRWSVRKQRLRFAEQLPGQLHELASAMRTGRSIAEGAAIIAETADEPMRRELQRALADERAGLTLDEALLPIAERMDCPEIEQVAVIAALHRRTGATITEVLDRIADTARQRVEIRRELLTMTAQARLSRNILVSLPVVVVIAFDIIGPQYEKPLFHTTLGIVVMVVAALMVTAGARVMKAIVQIEE